MAEILPFPQLLYQRLKKALTRLALETWRDPVPLIVERTRTRDGEFPFAEAKREKLSRVNVPCAWQANGFSTTWFRVRLPENFTPDAQTYFIWDDNAEATAYVDGQPVFGFDCTHRAWPWPKGAKEVWLESIFCQSGIWHATAKGIGAVGSLLTRADLVRKDTDSWNAYFDLETLADWLEEEARAYLPAQVADELIGGLRGWPEMDTASNTMASPDGTGIGVPNRVRPTLEKLPPLVRRVFAELGEAVVVYHKRGAAALRKRLQPVYRLLREQKGVAPRAVMTGNSHLDLVWLWPEAVGEKKAVRNCATVTRLLDENPDLYFCYSQPASYEAIKRRQPRLFERIRKHIASGRWEAAGGMYVESDILMPTGEALLRSFTVGQSELEKLRGSPNRILWLPDSFGYPACIPGIMKLAGVRYFYTTKASWNMIHRFPHSSFVWRGSDGSEVLAYLTLRTVYNNPARPRNLRLEADGDRQIDVHRELLMPTGWGDGAGGPTQDIVERVRRQKNLRNQPAAQFGSAEAFYKRMERVRGKLPVHQGEIYLEMHRGTYSTHGYVKAAYREGEKALRAWEAAHALAGAGAIDVAAWKRLIFAQFHDCIPGGSTYDVYREILPELSALRETAQTRAAAALAGAGKNLVFNPLALEVPWRTKHGLVKLPPLSASDTAALPAVAAPALEAGARRISNSRVSARFNAAGELERLTVDGAEALAGGVRLVAYRDVPYDHDAWEIDRDSLIDGEPLSPCGGAKIERGDGWVGVRQVWKTRGGSTADVLWRVREGGCTLEFEANLDWRESETLLRLEMQTPDRGAHAAFAAPYGVVWRPQLSGDPHSAAMWEVPANRWAMASNDAREGGSFIVAEAKYGYACHDGKLSVTLLKSAKVTVSNAFHPRFHKGDAGPKWSDLGKQTVRGALGRLSANAPREETPAALAETLFVSPLPVRGAARALPVAFEGLESVVPMWVAPLGANRFLLRLHETLGKSGEIRFAQAKAEGWKIRRLETAFPEGGKGEIVRGAVSVSPCAIIGLEFFK